MRIEQLSTPADPSSSHTGVAPLIRGKLFEQFSSLLDEIAIQVQSISAEAKNKVDDANDRDLRSERPEKPNSLEKDSTTISQEASLHTNAPLIAEGRHERHDKDTRSKPQSDDTKRAGLKDVKREEKASEAEKTNVQATRREVRSTTSQEQAPLPPGNVQPETSAQKNLSKPVTPGERSEQSLASALVEAVSQTLAPSAAPAAGLQATMQSLVMKNLGISEGVSKASSFTLSSTAGIQASASNSPGQSGGESVLGQKLTQEMNFASRPDTSATAAKRSQAFEQVEKALQEAARSRDGKTISLRLDPPELGRVRVDVSIRDGVLHARLGADSDQISMLLRERAHELQRMLRGLGLNVETVSVSVRGDSQDGLGAFSQNAGAGNFDFGKDSHLSSERDAAGVLTAPKTSPSTDDHWVA